MAQPLDWSQLYRDYPGQWVALKEDEKTIVASGKLAKAVYANAKEEGVAAPIMVKVPRVSLPYVGQLVTLDYPKKLIEIERRVG